MYLVKTPWLLKKIYPRDMKWNLPRNEKTIYLTFDDGPIPEVTLWVLETLKAYEAKATFFCIGDNVRKHPDVYQQVLAEGHATGNHTFHHLNGWNTADADYLRDIGECGNLVRTNLFRPPYGRIRRSQIRLLRQRDASMRLIMWDVLSGDFDRSLSPEKCLMNVLAHTESGSIVVFHDSLKAEERLRYTLPRALEAWKAKKFRFERLTL